MSYLAPSMVKAILDGTQPPELSRRQLIQANSVPLNWQQQEQLFGFA